MAAHVSHHTEPDQILRKEDAQRRHRNHSCVNSGFYTGVRYKKMDERTDQQNSAYPKNCHLSPVTAHPASVLPGRAALEYRKQACREQYG